MITEDQKRALSNWLPGRISHLNDKESIQEGGLTAGQFFQRASYQIALAALTQTASPALKLPDELQEKETDYQNLRDEKRGFNAAIAEVKRLNAPHTAPIEPICATGGAAWVKLTPEQAKKIYRDLDACQKVIHYARGFDPSYVTDAQDCLKIIDDALAAAPEVE